VFQCPGGGENQLVQTGRQLENLELTVRPFCSWRDALGDARLLHLFGMSREGLELARVARAARVPVVLSPIFWYEPSAIWALATSRARGAWNLAKWVLNRASPRAMGWRAALLASVDAILPNSRAEASQLVRLLRADHRKIRVVSNGVDPRFASADGSFFRQTFGDFDFVLYVGRIEPRKNALGLARVLRQQDLRLVAIGDPVSRHEEYARHCRREAGDSAIWLDRLGHEHPLLESAYAAARVFALPSWFETPGLAALEAAVAGCAVVVTPYGSTREYFGERAHYARPDRPAEIARAVAAAWDAGPHESLAADLIKRCSWQRVAQETKEVYDRVAP
jgi:glycosyltransferase involved in cell wall biosynthesis